MISLLNPSTMTTESIIMRIARTMPMVATLRLGDADLVSLPSFSLRAINNSTFIFNDKINKKCRRILLIAALMLILHEIFIEYHECFKEFVFDNRFTETRMG